MSMVDVLITGAMVAAICLAVALCWWVANRCEILGQSFFPGAKAQRIKGVCCECGSYSEECVIDDIRQHSQLFCPRCAAK